MKMGCAWVRPHSESGSLPLSCPIYLAAKIHNFRTPLHYKCQSNIFSPSHPVNPQNRPSSHTHLTAKLLFMYASCLTSSFPPSSTPLNPVTTSSIILIYTFPYPTSSTTPFISSPARPPYAFCPTTISSSMPSRLVTTSPRSLLVLLSPRASLPCQGLLLIHSPSSRLSTCM